MGKSFTPTYRLEMTHTQPTPRGLNRTITKIGWEGRATRARLEAWIVSYAKSLEAGGSNAHISKACGFIPYPNSAKLVRQRTNECVAEWHAALFQVW